LEFPDFPWINFEKELQAAIKLHQIYNLATCRRYVEGYCKDYELAIRKCVKRDIKPRHPKLYWGYNHELYDMKYDDKLKVSELKDVLVTYAQLYYIYTFRTSMLFSNYSIRTDGVLSDTGNFPLWDNDFFRRDSGTADEISSYAHIIDFDALRLGRKVKEGNYKADVFECGVVPMTEVGKDRGNQFDHKGIKKDDPEANQLNDDFNKWLKMIRHGGTVDHYPFVRVIMDEQRPESLGADARELCDIIHIRDRASVKGGIPQKLCTNAGSLPGGCKPGAPNTMQSL